MKIIVTTDTASSILPQEAKEKNIPIIPLSFIIDGKEYFQNVNLSMEEFYRILREGKADISTSQPSIGALTEFWDELLKEYDQIIHITLSSALSGSCQSAKMLAEEPEYEGRVFVPNLQRISVTQRQAVLDAHTLIAQGKTVPEIVEILEETKFDSSIYIVLETLKYLVKGGRLTPAAGLIANVLNLKPVLQIQGEKLDAFSKCRGVKKGVKIMLDALRNDLNTRFKEYYENGEMYMQVAHADCEEKAFELKARMEKEFPGLEVFVAPLSLEVACHVGPDALGAAVTRRLK